MQNYQLPENKVLVLRSCRPDMTSKNNFTWPTSGPVTCPDWIDNTACGYGLHGWLCAQGDYDLKYKEVGAKWLVVEVDASDIRPLDGKVKLPKGTVLFTGAFREAYDIVMKQFWLKHSNELRAAAVVDKDATYSNEDDMSVSTTDANSATLPQLANPATLPQLANPATLPQLATPATLPQLATTATLPQLANSATLLF